MCGITGGRWQHRSLSTEQKLADAISEMKQRGPDDRGCSLYEVPASSAVAGLGHTRLSIIDLSPSGHQPMDTANGVYSIVFNGEIYNYRELREELRALGHRFKSDSDTEVLLTAWRQWGQTCLPRLVGMFAFVVLDRERNTLTCVRDAFGIKPLLYAIEGDDFLFASSISAIKALKREKIELDWQRSYDYLVHGDYDSGPRTFLKNVFHLMPGHTLTVDLRTGKMAGPERWWTPSITERRDISFKDAADELRERFLNSVRLHLRSDVPLGVALSGGIDSSSVVCAIRHLEPDLPINTFSYIARGSAVSEEVWVDRVNQHVRAVPHKVAVTQSELAADLDEMIYAQGEPFGSTSIYASYRVFKLAKDQGVTVILDGQGADEMLAGYTGYGGQRIRSLIDKGQYGAAWSFLNEWAKWPGRSRGGAFARAGAQYLDGPLHTFFRQLNSGSDKPDWLNSGPLTEAGVIQHYPRLPPMGSDKGRRVVAELATSLHRRGLQSLLRHGDRNSMRFSVESRVPYLTLGMSEFLLSLPEEYLISPQGETKHIFRAAMRGIVSDDILDRRDKIGFATPEQDWLLPMAESIRQWLRADLNLPFLNQARMLKEFDLIVAGKKPFSFQVWRWVNFSRWHQMFINNA